MKTLLSIAGAMMLALSPAVAEECPSPIDMIVGQVLEGGGEFIGLQDVPGKDVDQMMVFRIGNAIVVGGAKDGCVVTPPIPVFEAKFLKPAVAA